MEHEAALKPGNRGKLIEQAAVSSKGTGATALLERAFALAFRGLVYPQIWEDPVADMAGLDLRPDDHVVTIASGGCNALSYLTGDPARITALDLNRTHIALGQLKHTAMRELPSYTDFRRFFGDASDPRNLAVYDTHIAPHLDAPSRQYWASRDWRGRKRITMFARGAYRHGLLGSFIGLAHMLARLHGENPRDILKAQTRAEQRAHFEQRFVPFFDKPLIRWMTNQPASLFGLGIPPAQYDKLAAGKSMADVLRQRLEKLTCDFDFRDNYFAWQAFSRGYAPTPDASLPPYLQHSLFDTVRARLDRVSFRQANMTDWLAAQQARSVDKFVLLDAQDWMNDDQLNALWSQICRTARPGARVLFRTADEPSLLPGQLAPDLLDMWEYRAAQSRALTLQDRSSIYGGVHLYAWHG